MGSSINYINKLNELESLANDAADEMVQHRTIITDYSSNLGNWEHPYSHVVLLSFIPRIESIRCGMLEVAKAEEFNSFRILLRSIIEHYCKYMYILLRYTEERNDDAGKEYFIYGHAKEDLDYIKAMENSAEMLERTLSRSAIDILNDLRPSIENVSASKLRETALQFTYKNTAKYIHEKMRKSSSTPSTLMISIIPLYSKLSSFVHGGPSSLIFSEEYANPEIAYETIIENYSVSQMMAFHVQLMTFLIFYQNDTRFDAPYNVINKYLEKMTTARNSGDT